MKIQDINCHICSKENLTEIAGFQRLSRVTSDCKPFHSGGRLVVCDDCGAVQKPATNEWKNDCDGIYRNYQPYFQSNGIEQSVYDVKSGKPELRSNILTKNLTTERHFRNSGKIIDVGCGNGVLLKAFGQLNNNWDLYGHELSDLNEPHLKKIDGFKKLYTGYPMRFTDKFDVITLIHSLEHFPDPLAGLVSLKKHMAQDGCLFVQVPNVLETPFDLVVADHASHFNKYDLDNLVKKSGMHCSLIADNWVKKELSLIATLDENDTFFTKKVNPKEIIARINKNVAWLINVIEQAKISSKSSKRFGIFGTSIASMWLFGELGFNVDFFVDEDPSRIGRELHGKRIYGPKEIPSDSVVYLALLPDVANRVYDRIDKEHLEFIIPPNV